MTSKRITLIISLFFLVLFQVSAQNLVSYERLGDRSLAQMNAKYGLGFFKNGVSFYKVVYKTPDIKGQPSLASGLVVIPDDTTKIYPLLVYQHGTASADSDVPSRMSGEAEFPILYASLGYVTVAPDYLGFGESPGFHPYVHAESESSVAVDLMRATRELMPKLGSRINKQNFITGYSQGGHAALALHRKLELELKNEFVVTASAPMSGPYSMGEIMRELVLSEKEYFYPAYIPNTIVSYQLAYGNIYNELIDVFRPEYLGAIEKFAKEELRLSQLNTQLIDLLKVHEGKSIPVRMFQQGMINKVLSDSLNPFNQALKLNNVYNWAPKAPTRLYYCRADDQVPYRNSVFADSVMNLLGASDIKAIDVNTSANHGQCVSPAFFNAALFFAVYQNINEVSTSSDEVKVNNLYLFPNPASTYITIPDFPESGNLVIRNLKGITVKSQMVTQGNNSIDVSNLTGGLYMLSIRTKTAHWVEKLFISVK